MKFALLVAALAIVVSAQVAAPAKPAGKKAAKAAAKQAKRVAKRTAKATAKATKAAAAKAAAPAAPAAPVAPAPAAAAPAAKRKIHHRKYDDYTYKTPRADLLKAHAAWNQDNSKYPRKPPALPKTFGLDRKRYQDKTTHNRIIEKDASQKRSRIPQFPHHNDATAKRVTFRRSDLDRRAINVQETCSGYSNQKLRDACQKRYGVFTDQTEVHSKKRIEEARQKCAAIKQLNRRRMCYNTYLRNGAVPYFAQDEEEQEDNDNEEQEEAIDADEDDNSEGGEEDEAEGQGLVQVAKGDDGEGDDEDDEQDDGEKDLMQVDDDEAEEETEGEEEGENSD